MLNGTPAVRLVIAQHSLRTGKHLAAALNAQGVRVTNGAKAVVSYGVPVGEYGVPVLNAKAGMADKLDELKTLRAAGILVPKIYGEPGVEVKFPMLARKRAHRGGNDLMPVLQAKEIPWRLRAGAEFFVEYIPPKSEFRTWVFRKAHLSTYEKVMMHPEKYKKLGWNFTNGFSFDLVPSERIPRGAVDLAVASVQARSLDFGAVDILQGEDGNFYVLEVNTAPGVESPERQPMRGLARHILKWIEDDFPSRKNAVAVTTPARPIRNRYYY